MKKELRRKHREPTVEPTQTPPILSSEDVETRLRRLLAFIENAIYSSERPNAKLVEIYIQLLTRLSGGENENEDFVEELLKKFTAPSD